MEITKKDAQEARKILKEYERKRNAEKREKHKNVLAGNSKAMFANAVKFDQKLKELNDEE